jgi:hypothetical protein
MIDYPGYVKKKLTGLIEEMAASPALFVENANSDFTRNRKLSFTTVMNLIISMGGNSICSELMTYFDYDVDTATSSAFIQQRNKLLPFAFEFLFHEFTHSFQDLRTYKGYRLFAVDGSDLNISTIQRYRYLFSISTRYERLQPTAS